jgi:hypothetical protein
VIPKRVGGEFENFQKAGRLSAVDRIDQFGPGMRIGESGEGGDSAKRGVVRASGAHFPKSGWKDSIGPRVPSFPPVVPKLFENRLSSGGDGAGCWIGKKTRNPIKQRGAAGWIRHAIKQLDGNGAGERGEWLPIFGKAQALG